MKKVTLFLVLILTCGSYVLGQLTAVTEYSEIERSKSNGKLTYTERGDSLTIPIPQTLEDYLTVIHREYGAPETQMIIDLIDNGEIHVVISKLIERGQKIKASVITDFCEKITEGSMTFIENGKLYTLTYDPLPAEYGFFWGTRDLYLYRRDAQSRWVRASEKLQTDNYEHEYVMHNGNKRQAITLSSVRTYTHLKDRGDKMAFGSVDRLANGMIAMFVTNVWKNKSVVYSTYKYNDFVLFVPTSNGNYEFNKYPAQYKETRFPDHVLSDGAYTLTENILKIETRDINTGDRNKPVLISMLRW